MKSAAVDTPGMACSHPESLRAFRDILLGNLHDIRRGCVLDSHFFVETYVVLLAGSTAVPVSLGGGQRCNLATVSILLQKSAEHTL